RPAHRPLRGDPLRASRAAHVPVVARAMDAHGPDLRPRVSMTRTLLLASDHLDPGAVAAGSLGAGVAFALTPGEGPSRNLKQQKNEDSLGVLAVPGGVAAIV